MLGGAEGEFQALPEPHAIDVILGFGSKKFFDFRIQIDPQWVFQPILTVLELGPPTYD